MKICNDAKQTALHMSFLILIEDNDTRLYSLAYDHALQ